MLRLRGFPLGPVDPARFSGLVVLILLQDCEQPFQLSTQALAFRLKLAELAPAPFDSGKHIFGPKWDGGHRLHRAGERGHEGEHPGAHGPKAGAHCP